MKIVEDSDEAVVAVQHQRAGALGTVMRSTKSFSGSSLETRSILDINCNHCNKEGSCCFESW